MSLFVGDEKLGSELTQLDKGNTGGLGGVEGINYAAGSPSPSLTTRPLPHILGRLRKKALEPWTKIGVDDYVLEGPSPVAAEALDEGRPISPLDKLRAMKLLETPSVPSRPPTPQQVLAAKQAETARKAADAVRARSEAVLAANAEREAARKARELASKKAKASQEAAVVAATSGGTPTRFRARPSRPWSFKVNPEAASAVDKKVSSVEKVATRKREEAATAASKRKAEEVRDSQQRAQQNKDEKRIANATSRRKAAEVAKTSKQRLQQEEEKKKGTVAAAMKREEDAKNFKRRAEQDKKEKEAAIDAAKKARAIEAAEQAKASKRRALQEEEKRKAAVAAATKKANDAKDAKRKAEQEEKAKKAAIAAAKKAVVITPRRQTKGVAETLVIKSSQVKPVPPSKPPPSTAFANFKRPQVSRTIALPKKVDTKMVAARQPSLQRFSPPKGVPSLTRWKSNRDGSVMGLITGSDQFTENERITTSPIVKGVIAPGNVVVTSSGSKYFLN